jgi:gamma-glutamyl phosphate reductase
MPSVLIWTPESDYDRDAVLYLARKIVEYYNADIKIACGTKQGFNEAAKKPDGLKKAVEIYLKKNDIVVFLVDADGTKSQAQRRNERNSLVNRIQAVVNASGGKALLILILQELEAWLLVDCLGICCYYTKNCETRNSQEWIEFAKRKQPGRTDLIEEAEIGGKNAKEYLEKLSKEILIKINPNLKNKPQNLKERQYREEKSLEIAKCIEINNQTIKRNVSLEEFAYCLKRLAEV